MARRDVTILLGLAVVSCTSVDRCVKSPKAAIVDRLKSAARFETNGVEADMRTGLCGFRPGRTTQAEIVGTPEVHLQEEGDHGTGEITAKLALSVASAHTCEGRLGFAYRYHPAMGKHPSYYEISDVKRLGPPPSWVGELVKRARSTDVGAPSTAFAEGSYVLPDGRVAAAFAFDVPERGPYTLRLARTYPPYEGPVLFVYQDERTPSEGDGTGALGFYVLERGRAILVATMPKVDPTEVRVVRHDRRPQP